MRRIHEKFRIDRRFVIPAVTAALLTLLALPQPAAAQIKVAVRVNTPSVDVILKSGGHRQGAVVIRPEQRFGIRLSENDRQVARVLARRSGYRQGELLRLRAAGFGWRQIGRMLDLPAKLVNRALKVARQDDRQGRRGHAGGRIVMPQPEGCRR